MTVGLFIIRVIAVAAILYFTDKSLPVKALICTLLIILYAIAYFEGLNA